jgi:hypothetical protein
LREIVAQADKAGTSGGLAKLGGCGAQGSQSVDGFRQIGCPDVITGEVDVFPSQGRQMGEQVIGHRGGGLQGGDGALKVADVPQDDGANHQRQSPGRRNASAFANPGRSSRLPLA